MVRGFIKAAFVRQAVAATIIAGAPAIAHASTIFSDLEPGGTYSGAAGFGSALLGLALVALFTTPILANI